MKKPAKTSLVIAAAVTAALFCNCEMQTAGSSVGTGNPTEIQVAFTGTGGSPQGVTGSMDIYAATQVTVPGFQPEPLAHFDINGDKSHSLLGSDLKGVADSLWPKSSHEGDSILRFNVVVKGDSQGVIIQDLGFRRADATFSVPDSLKNPSSKDGAVMVWGDLKEMVPFTISMDTAQFDPEQDYFLFLAGTGFHAENEGASFTFGAVPYGVHHASFLQLWKKNHGPASQSDSAYVYSIKSEFNTASPETISVGAISDSVPLPPEYK